MFVELTWNFTIVKHKEALNKPLFVCHGWQGRYKVAVTNRKALLDIFDTHWVGSVPENRARFHFIKTLEVAQYRCHNRADIVRLNSRPIVVPQQASVLGKCKISELEVLQLQDLGVICPRSIPGALYVEPVVKHVVSTPVFPFFSCEHTVLKGDVSECPFLCQSCTIKITRAILLCVFSAAVLPLVFNFAEMLFVIIS